MESRLSVKKVSESYLYEYTEPLTLYSDRVTFLIAVRGRAELSSAQVARELSAGGVLMLLSPGIFTLTPTGSSVLLRVEISPLLAIEAFHSELSRLSVDSDADKRNHDTLRNALVRIALLHTTDKTQNSFLIRSALYELFHILRAEYETETLTDSFPELKEKQRDKVEALYDFLSSHYTSPITLQDAAAALSFTPQYLSNFLQKHLHTTFLTMLQEIRLRSAKMRLLHSDDSVARIALLSGFSGEEALRKQLLKSESITPEELRETAAVNRHAYRGLSNQLRNAVTIRDYLNNYLPGTYVTTPAIEARRPVTITLDASKSVALHSTWDQLLNLGTAVNLEDPTFRLHLQTIQDGLHFRYARVSGILLLAEIYTDEEEQLSFGFTRIFSLLDYLLSMGLHPFLDFDNKLPKRGRNRLAFFAEEEYDRATGELLIPEFLRECVNRYGFDEVSLWSFELWQRFYDEGMTQYEPGKDYAERFAFVYQTVKTLVPKAQVGGPGFNTFLPEELFSDTLFALQEKGLHPDFLSCYLYPYLRPEDWLTRTEPEFRLSTDPDEFSKRLSSLRACAERMNMEHIPIIVTEFSSNIIYRNHINDTPYLAVFLLRNFLRCREQVSGMGYWLASDASLEYRENEDFLFGGNGLLNRMGLRKPGFFAYAWLSHLDHRLIGEGEHFILTAGDDEYKLLLFHYSHFTEEYCEKPMAFDEMRFPDGAFMESAPVELHITLHSLPPGRYRITRQRLDHAHGNLFQEWSRLHFLSRFSRYERAQLTASCSPSLSVDEVTIEGSYAVEEILPRHTVTFLLIRHML